MILRCIIVDDEPLARKVIQNYLKDIPQLQLVASCSHAIEAMEVIRQDTIDLIFLDINLPKLSGIHFLQSLTHPPRVIFVTAYPEHAVEGFELEAIDYLVKPFSFERFLKAVNRVLQLYQEPAFPKVQNTTPDALLIKADKKWYRLKMDTLLYFQAYGDYVKVFTDTAMYLVKEKLSEMENRLPPEAFFKIHRSYIVRLNAINYVEGKRLRVKEAFLPIAAPLKETLLSKLGNGKPPS